MSGKKKKTKTASQKVKIYSRVRNLMPWEPRQTSLRVLAGNKLRNKTPKTENEYSFTKVFGTDIQNPYMFKVIVQPMIDNVLKGFNAVLIAYGQTGSGKTFSMLGKPNLGVIGLLPMMLQQVVETPSVFKLELSAVEAFGHHVARIELFDLYDPRNQVPNWSEKNGNTGQEMSKAIKKRINDLDEAYEMIKYAHAASHFAPTGKNPESSRGHVTFVAKVHQSDPSGTTANDLISYFIMLDCAGSEGESAFTKEFKQSVDKHTLLARRLEAGTINTGLSSLQIIFNELRVRGRLSKMVGNGLRRVLHPFINTSTFLAVLFTFSPSVNNAKATESTLKFAVTAGMVKVSPVKAQLSVNVEKLVQQLRAIIAKHDTLIDIQQDKISDLEAELIATKQDAMTAGNLPADFDYEGDDEEVIGSDGKKHRRKLADNILAKLDYLDEDSSDDDYTLDAMFATSGNDASALAELERELEAAFALQNAGTDAKQVKQAMGMDDEDGKMDIQAGVDILNATIQAGTTDVTDMTILKGQEESSVFIDYDALQIPELVNHCQGAWGEIADQTGKQVEMKKTQKQMVGHLQDTNEWLFSTLSTVLSEKM